jgi:hypothetical protein
MLSSMRFAIALLTVICIASVIGTVLKQHEPLSNYINQFGPFWAELFMAAKPRLRVQRLVVSADIAVPGDQHLAVHRAQHAAHFCRPEDLQGKHPRAEPEGFRSARREPVGRGARPQPPIASANCS